MEEVTYNVKVVAKVSDTNTDAKKLLGREIVAGIALGTDGNINVEDIAVTSIQAVEVITEITDCMPEEVPSIV